MKRTCLVFLLSAFAFAWTAHADDVTTGHSWFLNYDWMDKVVNKTPTPPGQCPTLNVDQYHDGFKVAKMTSFFGSFGPTAAKWFPKDSIWSSVGVSPMKSNFGIMYSNVDTKEQVDKLGDKQLPYTAQELTKWRISDSAYWESQGGVSFYVGTGMDPIGAGIFAVATGGWVNYLEKTGPTKIYVERAHKDIRGISFGAGISYPSFSIDKVVEDATGYSYEFNLDRPKNIEAFERFMAGDLTKTQELTKVANSGIMKIADTMEKHLAFSRNWGIGMPIIPLISFRFSTEQSYDHSEENSVWDEKVSKDYGMYVKQRTSRILGFHRQVVRSFVGARVVKDLPGDSAGRNVSENLSGVFKYSYQSNYGQENRLRKYIADVAQLTGLSQETCLKVPDLQNSLTYNQVVLEVNWSDSYVRGILGLGKSPNILNHIKKMALNFEAKDRGGPTCDQNSNFPGSDSYDNNCEAPVAAAAVFQNLEDYSKTLRASYATDKKLFVKTMAKFGQEIWKSPVVFKAFFEKGKQCGQDFKYEVSGTRITQFVNSQKWANSDSCLN